MKNKENNRKPPCRVNDTWAIRGIEAETRTAATMAARKAGLTVGEWCNRAIREAATERLKERVPGPTMEETLAKLAESMARTAEATQQQTAAIAARLEALERGSEQESRESRGNLFVRLHGLLRRPTAQPNPVN